MLPVLFAIVIPAGLVKPAAVLAVLLVVLALAFAWRRRSARDGHPVSWGSALGDDGVVSVVLVVALGVLWRAGLLDADLLVPLDTYGLLIATGFITGIWLAQREGRRRGQDPERIADLTFWILVAALVGSRVYFILVNWRDYFEPGTFLVATSFGRIPRVLAIWEGGLVFYGGFIGAVLVAWFYMRRHGMNFLAHADTLIPSVALGHFFGRLGCFAAGCCYGRETHVPWAAVFRDPATLAPRDLPIHPTQLYASLDGVVLFVALILLQRVKRFDGQIFSAFLIGYALLRYLVEEPFRADARGATVEGFSVSVATGVPVLLVGLALMIFLGWRARSARAA
jgi:phosphatidylglycerol:prolipoprotein diacylglycerol transferase